LIASIRSIRDGRGGRSSEIAAALEKLKLPELKTILGSCDKEAKRTIVENKCCHF